MKQLAADFETIFKKDKGLIVWMLVDFALSVWMFVVAILNLNAGRSKIYPRYSDSIGGYEQRDWWYLLSFAIIATVLGAGHLLICARLHSKRGRDVARLFLGISCAVLVLGLHVLYSVVGEG